MPEAPLPDALESEVEEDEDDPEPDPPLPVPPFEAGPCCSVPRADAGGAGSENECSGTVGTT